MTSNQAKIVLTNPCSESWDSMQVDAIGRFCQSCQKSVIDFSSKSDDEIKAFLKDKQGEKLCGRFYIHQVERIRIEIDPNLLVSNIPSWQKFLVVFLVCFGQDFLGCDFIFAQTETDSIPLRTEQVDSLVSVSFIQEPDSTLEAAVDSVQKPIHLKKKTTLVQPISFEIGGYIGGSITFVDERLLDELGITFPAPHPKIPLSQDQSQEDTITFETGIARVPQNNPLVPGKRPRKKPLPPENALIADAGDRRKTRRS